MDHSEIPAFRKRSNIVFFGFLSIYEPTNLFKFFVIAKTRNIFIKLYFFQKMENCKLEMTQITPSLYLSGIQAVTNKLVDQCNINLIINATKESPIFGNKHFPPKHRHIRIIRVPEYDSTEASLLPYFKVRRTQCTLWKNEKNTVTEKNLSNQM